VSGPNGCGITPLGFEEFTTNNQGQFQRHYIAVISNCGNGGTCSTPVNDTIHIMGVPFVIPLTYGCTDVTIHRN
jgi:hypothetical protein